ncbi:MAG TPA: DUF4339 domain-containing protein [Acidobacteriaceae bacterium]|nr:DUF4339 domain-containing protein [Acidobacteriaceae bacterium]
MTYRIARGGQTFGPYTDAEIRQYLITGNIGMADLVQAEGSGEWVPVLQIFPLTQVPPMPAAAPYIPGPKVLYPDPPDFPWWGALLLGMVTGFLFFVVWDIVQASWLKRIDKGSRAFLLYIGLAVLYVFKLPGMWSTMDYNMFGGPLVHSHGGTLSGLGFVLAIVARFVFRRELLEHFNGREGIPLQLNGFLTLIFGGLYFQYQFNKINEVKRATNRSVPAV